MAKEMSRETFGTWLIVIAVLFIMAFPIIANLKSEGILPSESGLQMMPPAGGGTEPIEGEQVNPAPECKEKEVWCKKSGFNWHVCTDGTLSSCARPDKCAVISDSDNDGKENGCDKCYKGKCACCCIDFTNKPDECK